MVTVLFCMISCVSCGSYQARYGFECGKVRLGRVLSKGQLQVKLSLFFLSGLRLGSLARLLIVAAEAFCSVLVITLQSAARLPGPGCDFLHEQ